MRTIDLRRDTITLPDSKMKKAAFDAPLGDSVYGEDRSQNELEERAARALGKDAALFIPSGTMGNLVALLSHTERGDEIILEENAHIRTSETGGAACVGGLMFRTLYGKDGAPDAEDVAGAIRAVNIHYPKTALICLENTHYRYGGIVVPLEKFRSIREVSLEFGIPVHLDGARVFNAAVYLGVPVTEITGLVDTVMVSLSKGLGAPVGSVLAGPVAFIDSAKRYRKMLGGGMRQTGWLAACGILSLSDENISRLREDHENASLLASGLYEMNGVSVDVEKTHTNFVLARFEDPGFSADRFAERLSARGVLITPSRANTVRFVTSKEVTREDIVFTLHIIEEVLQHPSQ